MNLSCKPTLKTTETLVEELAEALAGDAGYSYEAVKEALEELVDVVRRERDTKEQP
jgi:hypothetical protein